jgi:hypothetical protein
LPLLLVFELTLVKFFLILAFSPSADLAVRSPISPFYEYVKYLFHIYGNKKKINFI